MGHVGRRRWLRLMRMRDLGLSQHFAAGVGNSSGNANQLSTARVGNTSGNPAWGEREEGGRFGKNNPWRWQRGQSGNPRGRPRKTDDKYGQTLTTLLGLIAKVKALEWGHVRQPDERLVKFRVLYEVTGNAFRSAVIAGYSPKTATSKAYLLAAKFRKPTINQ